MEYEKHYERKLVFFDGDREKLWNIEFDGKLTTTLSYGKKGNKLVRKEKIHENQYKALEHFSKSSNKKMFEGYVCLNEQAGEQNGYIRLMLARRGGGSQDTTDIHPTEPEIAVGYWRMEGMVDDLIIDIVSIETGRLQKRHTFEGQSGCRGLRYSPDGKYIVFQNNKYGPKTMLLDCESGESSLLSDTTKTAMEDGLFFAGNRLFIQEPEKILIFDFNAGEILYEREFRGAFTAALSHEGDQLALIEDKETQIKIIDVKTRKLQFRLDLGEGYGAKYLAFRPGGKFLVAASVIFSDINSHATLAWNLETKQPYLPEVFEKDGDWSHFVATFSPDGKYLVTGGYFYFVTLRDFDTGQETLQFYDHYKRVYGARFSPDGKFLVTTDYNGCIIVVHELKSELLKDGYEGPRF